MGASKVDRRFALISDDGDVLFPHITYQASTNREGFALSTADNKNKHGGGYYTNDLAEVIRRVVFNGDAVRVTTVGKEGRERTGSIGLGKRSCPKFYVTPEFEVIVKGAQYERVYELPAQRQNRGVGGVLAASIPAAPVASQDILADIENLDVNEYIEALRGNEASITDNQRRMLAAHYAAPEQLQSIRQLATAAKLSNYTSANLEYGKVGHLVADDVGLDSPGNWMQFLARPATPKTASDGDFGWIMRDNLARALEELGWVETQAQGLDAQAARLELESESPELPETTKVALVNARVGQGGYRKRMLNLWGGRCAVTGCEITEVLVASHAKSWVRSTTRERLDEYNGLLLVANLDKLFDRGLIGFADDGSIVKSSDIEWNDLATLGVTSATRLRAIQARHVPYLRAHRQEHALT